MVSFVNWNGKLIREDRVVISPNNRSFRYGDGCFETMKVIEEKIILEHLHFERLLSSLKTLRFNIPDFFTAEYLSQLIVELVRVNHHTVLARVRLVVYRGNGGIYDLQDNNPHFIIQSFPGDPASAHFNTKGLDIDFYFDARKTGDHFSAIKSNNYLCYVMGAIWARENNLEDCIILNSFNHVADATIANIFIVLNGAIKTPALSQGCIGGVMRKYLLSCLLKTDINFFESEITPDELLNATEVFLTNAAYGIRWVQKTGNSSYTNATSSFLHERFIVPLFTSANLLE